MTSNTSGLPPQVAEKRNCSFVGGGLWGHLAPSSLSEAPELVSPALHIELYPLSERYFNVFFGSSFGAAISVFWFMTVDGLDRPQQPDPEILELLHLGRRLAPGGASRRFLASDSAVVSFSPAHLHRYVFLRHQTSRTYLHLHPPLCTRTVCVQTPTPAPLHPLPSAGEAKVTLTSIVFPLTVTVQQWISLEAENRACIHQQRLCSMNMYFYMWMHISTQSWWRSVGGLPYIRNETLVSAGCKQDVRAS